jgi:hypothetical protein
VGNDAYSMKLLALTGILLANSLNKEKASLLFEHSDPLFTKKVKKADFSQTLDDLIAIVSIYTPLLVKDENF